MAKWYGAVGYRTTVEVEPGYWEEQIIDRFYYGEIISNRWLIQNSGNINDNINISNTISIVADPFAIQKCSEIIYVEYAGTKWKVSSIEPQFPRLLLTLGGVYNE